MSEHADGTIIVDTEIDPQGFEADSAKLQKAIQSLNRKMATLGTTFKKAMSGNGTAVTAFQDKAAELENTVADIEKKMEHLGNEKVQTDAYAQLCKEANAAEQALLKLYNRQERMEAVGVKTDSQSWKALQYDIRTAQEAVERFEKAKTSMEQNGTAFQLGSSTDEYARLSDELKNARTQLTGMRSAMNNAQSETTRFGSAAQRVKASLSGVGKAGQSGFQKVLQSIKKGISGLNNLRKSSGRASNSVGGLNKQLSFLRDMFKFMITQKLLSAVVTGAKEGMDNLAQYSSKFNKQLSTLMSGLTQLKNSLATAFAPILTVVTPALSTLIRYLSTAITYIGQLFAALTGATTFTKATAVQEDYAASLEGTAEAAEKAQSSLTGFDEINALNDNSANTAGAAGTVSPSEMFEEVPIESKITDFVNRIKEAFRAGDYEGIGKILGDGINTAVQKAKSYISWENVGGTVTQVVQGIADGFNGLVDAVKWEDIGDTLAQGLNTVLYTLQMTVEVFNWEGMAASLSRGLNGLVTGTNWNSLGTLLSTSLTTALSTLRSAISTFKWEDLGAGISKAFNNIRWAEIFEQIGGLISDSLNGVLDLILGVFRNLEWGQLGTDLWNGLVSLVQNIEWGDILAKIIEGLSTLMYGLGAAALGLVEGVWESIKNAWNSLKEYYQEKINEAGGNVILGWLQGIIDGFKNIGTWIKDHILTPFLDGFKNAFGIHSPSTVMQEQGGFVTDGLLNGISGAWTSITTFIDTKLTEMKTALSNGWSTIKTNASTAWNNIKTTVSDKLSGIKTSASDTFTNLKNSATTWGKDLCSNMASGIRNATSKVSSAVSNVASKIKSLLGFSEPEDGPLSDFHTYMPDMIDLMTLGIRKNQKTAIQAVSDMAGAISEEIQGGDYAFGEAGFDSAIGANLTTFSDKIVDGFASLMSRLQSIAENITFAAPVLSTGTVVPYAVSSAATRQTQPAADTVISGIAERIKQGFLTANTEQNALLREQNELLREILAKDSRAVIRTSDIQTAFTRKNRRGGVATLPVTE